MLIAKMGYVGYFYIESKSFELRVGDGSQNIKLTEWGRMNLNKIYLGEERLVWLLKMMNELVSETTGIGACRDHRVSGSVMFLQKRMNKYGRFMEITEYGRRGRRSFVVIPEGREGQGWRQCILQMGRLVKYLEQTKDTTKKSLPVQPRVVVPGRTFADVVEGKKPETGEEKRVEGSMGISAAEINVGTVENSEKGKEKILETGNQATLKWEDMVVLLNEGVVNLRNMRDMLEDIRGKVEILESRHELGCVEKKKDNMDMQYGPEVQMGQNNVGKESGLINKPNLCCSKTYYRRRYREVAKRRAMRVLRREQKGTQMSPEGSPEARHPGSIDRREQKESKMSGREQIGTEMSPEVSSEVTPELIRSGATDRREQKGPEMSPELIPESRCPIEVDYLIKGDSKYGRESSEVTPAREEATERENVPVSGEGRSKEGEKTAGRTNRDDHTMGQSISPRGSLRGSWKGHQSCSPERRLKSPKPPTLFKENSGEYMIGQQSREIMLMEGSKERRLGTPLENRHTVGDADMEGEECRREQKGLKELEEVHGVENENACVGDIEELMGAGQGVDTGLEDIVSGSMSNSWVIDSCMEFYPKVGVTCEGEENNMKMLLKGIEDARKQSDVEGVGMSNRARVSRQMRELKNLNCFVNYDRGTLDVQQGKGRGRGRHGVL